MKEECLQFHSDLKWVRCAPHVWHGICPGDTPIRAKPSQACLMWRSRLRCWCALAILVVSLEVTGRKHCPWRNTTGRNHTLSGFAKSSGNLYAPCTVFLYAHGPMERYTSIVELFHLEPVSDIHWTVIRLIKMFHISNRPANVRIVDT